MVMNPDVQLKAQEELDKVIGRGRLPEVEDKESLPYTSALLKEVLRWQPTVYPSVSRILPLRTMNIGECVFQRVQLLTQICGMVNFSSDTDALIWTH
jgi:cytochrome P450